MISINEQIGKGKERNVFKLMDAIIDEQGLLEDELQKKIELKTLFEKKKLFRKKRTLYNMYEIWII